LKELGFVYQIGHDEECKRPETTVSSLLVIDICGVIPIRLQYCACGKFDSGVEGHWQQIRYNGWHPSMLNHVGVCATFETRAHEKRIYELRVGNKIFNLPIVDE
jgi:CxC2 like cysteine cluster associated with KDZ transposases